MQQWLKYFVYQIDSKSAILMEIAVADHDFIKNQLKIQWMQSMGDVYRKFLASATDSSYFNNSSGVPFFYIKNSNFIAFFQMKEKKAKVTVCPSLALKRVIDEANIPKRVDHITHEDEEEQEQEEEKKDVSDNDEDDLITDQDRLNYLLNNDDDNK